MTRAVTKNRAPLGFAKQFAHDCAESESDECIFYPYGNQDHGRPRIGVDGKPVMFSRYILSLKTGVSLETKLNALHDPVKCNNGKCCNPNHMRWGTHEENQKDRRFAGTAISNDKIELAKFMYATSRPIEEIKNFLAPFKLSPSIYSGIGRSGAVTRAVKADPTYADWFNGASMDDVPRIRTAIVQSRRRTFRSIATLDIPRNDKMKLMRGKGFTLERIGRQYGLTRERVRQLTCEKYIKRNPKSDWHPMVLLFKDIGLETLSNELRVSKQAICLARSKRQLPCSWYLVIKRLAHDIGKTVPDDWFKFKGVAA